MSRGRNDVDTCGEHALVRGFEIIDAEEHSDAAGELLADGSRLLLAVSACEENAGLAARRPDHHPPLRPAVVRLGRSILHELKLQDVNEESNGAVVVTNDKRDEFKMGHGARVACSAAVPL